MPPKGLCSPCLNCDKMKFYPGGNALKKCRYKKRCSKLDLFQRLLIDPSLENRPAIDVSGEAYKIKM